jgi:hypothetical protein
LAQDASSSAAALTARNRLDTVGAGAISRGAGDFIRRE